MGRNELEFRKGAEDKDNWDQQWEYDEALGQWKRRNNSVITKQILPDVDSYNFINSDKSNSIDGYEFEDGRYDSLKDLEYSYNQQDPKEKEIDSDHYVKDYHRMKSQQKYETIEYKEILANQERKFLPDIEDIEFQGIRKKGKIL